MSVLICFAGIETLPADVKYRTAEHMYSHARNVQRCYFGMFDVRTIVFIGDLLAHI